MMKKYFYIPLFLACVFFAATIIPSGDAFAGPTAAQTRTCLDNAASRFTVNKLSSPYINVYNELIDVSPGKGNWGLYDACHYSTDGHRGLFWVVDKNGYSKSGGKWVINANAYIKRTGTTTIAVMGVIMGNKPKVDVYATHVSLCKQKKNNDNWLSDDWINKNCWGAIGISRGSHGWNYNSSYKNYFLRTTKESAKYIMSDPEDYATININADTLFASGNATIYSDTVNGQTYYYTYLYAFRGWNGTSPGWSTFKVLVEDEAWSTPPTLTARSTIKNKTRNGSETAYDATAVQTINAHIGETVTFKHYYTGINYWQSSTTCTPSFNNRSNSATFSTGRSLTWGNACKYSGIGTASDGVKRFTNAGGGFNSDGLAIGDFTIPSTATNRSTYCEQIGYSNLGTNGGSGSSAGVCARVYLPSTFDSKTKVTVGDQSKESSWDTEDGNLTPTYVTDNASVVVKFDHTFRRQGVTDSDAEMNYSISFSKSAGTATSGNKRTETSPYKFSKNTTTGSLTQEEYTVTLRYDEEITVCETITHSPNYYEDTGKSAVSEKSKACVTIKRNPATCAINSQNFGIYSGYNIGRAGVELNGSDFTYTSTNTADFTRANGYKSIVNVWARPNDSLRFRYDLCAGAQYALNNNGITGYDATYTISATSVKGSTGYLFGNSLSTDKNVTTKVFNKSNAGDNDGFLTSKFAITRNSPSDDADSQYNCAAAGSSGFHEDHYRIPALPNTNNCNSASYTNASDVGNIITQTMTWNDVEVVGSKTQTPSVSGTHNGTIFTAQADAYIPYNYYLMPYASRSGNSQTVTPGGSFIVGTYLPVLTRTNSQVGGDAYATLTKATKIRVVSFMLRDGTPTSSATTYVANGNQSTTDICNYAVQSGTVHNCTAIDTGLKDKDYVLNSSATGQLGGTAGDVEGAIISGQIETTNLVYSKTGSFIKNVTVSVPESTTIGDKFCIAVAAWPSDSHNIGLADSVNSTSQGIALSSSAGTGAKWAVSAPNCVTVAKYPSFSVEGSDLTVAGPVNTRISKYGGRNYVSWAEYSIR
ncbi:MAG: hypothetical protein Q4D22_04665, partial [Candidatus Saccharibacteria bacterium]|nr:hypothetical protein [Candidatus Saccharibacteria bacterium]